MYKKVQIVGAGLAGCEAALTLASSGIEVELIDTKPKSMSLAHKNPNFGELVCSNSFKGINIETSNGLLKEEMRRLGCRLLDIADSVRVEAGGALAVDRDLFAQSLTKEINANKNIKTICNEYTSLDPSITTIIATGPLTSDSLALSLKSMITKDSFCLSDDNPNVLSTPKQSGIECKHNNDFLYFFDAVAPIVDAATIDYSKAFFMSRYDKGGADYINCPMTLDEYKVFVSELISAERVKLKDFENTDVFEGCMPIEVMASRGHNALRFGPMKPVGLTAPDGTKPYAVVQLRAENKKKTAYNLVGFQTNLTFKEQKRVFSLIPALKDCEYYRFGVMHRNTYLDAPHVLDDSLRLKMCPNVYIAGQLSGVEGYVESIMTGMVAARNIMNQFDGKPPLSLPNETMIGAILKTLRVKSKNFQPIASNFGLLPSMNMPPRDKKERYAMYAKRALNALSSQISI